MAARRRKGIDLPGWVIFLILLAVAWNFVQSWASGSWVRWTALGVGVLFVLWLAFRFVRWSVRRASGRKGSGSGVRSRKRFRFWPFTINLHGRWLPLPSSWGTDVGPWSWNSRTKRHRVDVPGPWWWQSERTDRPRPAVKAKEDPKPRPGEIFRAPPAKWVKTDQFLLDHNGQLELDPITMEPFPLDVTECNGCTVVRYPRPASEKAKERTGYLFNVEGAAEFKSWKDAYQACMGVSGAELLIRNIQRKTEAGR